MGKVTAGLSGLSVGMLAVGGVVALSGMRNASVSDTLRAVLKGQALPSGKSTIEDSRQTVGASVAAATGNAIAAGGQYAAGGVDPGVKWGMDAGVNGASDKLIWQFVQSQGINGLKVVSAYRPGSTAPGGNLDNHSRGQAVDVVGTEQQLDQLMSRLGYFGGAAGRWVTNTFFADLGWRVAGHAPGDNMHMHVGMSLSGVQAALAKRR